MHLRRFARLSGVQLPEHGERDEIARRIVDTLLESCDFPLRRTMNPRYNSFHVHR